MKYDEPFEYEQYDSIADKIVLGGVILTVIISIALVIWEPDVEAIGNWIFNLIK